MRELIAIVAIGFALAFGFEMAVLTVQLDQAYAGQAAMTAQGQAHP